MALRINPPQPPRPVLGPPRQPPVNRVQMPSWTAGYQTQTPTAPQPPQPTAQPAAQEWPSPHPPNAYYISDDGLVSYDEQGYRLDSNGNRAFGGGGGGGGSSSTLPAYYQQPFEQLFGTLGSYYTPARGGMEQASTDYQTLGNMWAQETGIPLAPEQWGNLFSAYGNYARNHAQPLAVPNFMGWVRSNMLTRPAAPPPIAYLKVGEL